MQTITSSVPVGTGWRSIVPLGPHRLVIGAFAIGVAAAAMAWQWNWLVAIGVAPVLLSVAPCAAMCGLGLCMHRVSGRSCSTASTKAPHMQAGPGRIESPSLSPVNNGDVA